MLAEISYHMPVFSAVLLLIAGVLVGFALTFSQQNQQESIQRDLDELKDQNDDLHDALQQQRDAYARLERKYTDQEGEWVQLVASSRRLEDVLRQREAERSSLDVSLSNLHQIKQDSLQELAQERSERARLAASLESSQERVSEARREIAELRGELNELRRLRDERGEWSDKLARLESELQRERQAKQELDECCQQLSRELAEQDMASKSDDRGGDREPRGEHYLALVHSQEVGQLHAQIRALQERLEAVQAEKDLVVSQWETEHRQRQSLTGLLQRSEEEVARKVAEIEELVAQTVAAGQAENALAVAMADLRRVTAERDDALTERDQLQTRLDLASGELDSYRRAVEAIERKRQQLSETLETTTARSEEYQTALRGKQRSLEETQIRLEQHLQQMQHLERDRDEARATLSSLQQHADQLEQSAQRAVGEADRIRGEREEVLQTLRQEQARSRQLEEQLQAAQGSDADAIALRAALQQVQAELVMAHSQLQTDADHLRELEQTCTESHAAQARLQDLVQELRHELRKNGETITELRRSSSTSGEEEAQVALNQLRPTLAELRNQLVQYEERLAAMKEQKSHELDELREQLEYSQRQARAQAELIHQLREQLAARGEALAQLEHAFPPPAGERDEERKKSA